MTELVRSGAAAAAAPTAPDPGVGAEVDGGARRARLPRRIRGSRRSRQGDRATPYLLLAPAALVLGLVLGYPLVRLVTRLVAPAYAHDELRVTGAVSDVGPGWAELTVRATLTQGVHAEAVARVSTMPA